MSPLASSRLAFNPSSSDLSALTEVPLFFGYVFSFLLQGILMVQVFAYQISFPRDSRWLKLLVWLVFFLECTSSFWALYAAINSLLKNDALYAVELIWAFRILGPLCGAVTLLVHIFYSWRIRKLGNLVFIPIIIIVISLGQCVMVSISGVMFTLEAGDLTIDHPDFLAINIVWLGGSGFCDIIITVTLVVLLHRAASNVRRSQTKSILDRVIMITVETGMVTGFGALTELILFLVFRNTFIHFVLFLLLPKLYANCMMATLNGRLFMPGRVFEDGTGQSPVPCPTTRFDSPAIFPASRNLASWENSSSQVPIGSKDFNTVSSQKYITQLPFRDIYVLSTRREIPHDQIALNDALLPNTHILTEERFRNSDSRSTDSFDPYADVLDITSVKDTVTDINTTYMPEVQSRHLVTPLPRMSSLPSFAEKIVV